MSADKKPPDPFVLTKSAEAGQRVAPPAPMVLDPATANIVPAVEEAAAPAVGPARRRSWAGSLILAGVVTLVGLGAGIEGQELVTSLAERDPVMGFLGAAGIGAVCVGLLWLGLSELAGFWRQRRLGDVRAAAEAALRHASQTEAEKVVTRLEGLYRGRQDLAWARDRHRELAGQMVDARDKLALYEQQVIRPIDEAAVRVIAETARTTALATAISPYATLDGLIVAWRTLAMIRRIAELYGGRAGSSATLALLRRSLAHIVLAGGVEAGDGLINELVGGGITGAVSARLSQGLVNGLLAARLGIAAIELMRPVPYIALEKPRARAIAGSMIADLRRLF